MVSPEFEEFGMVSPEFGIQEGIKGCQVLTVDSSREGLLTM